MATDNHIKKYTAADIERYHKGQLSLKEMHALEKAALDDPFLADAMEGYTTPGVNVASDIAELQKRLEEKTDRVKVIPLKKAGSNKFPLLRIAAMIVVLAGAAYLVTQLTLNKKDDEIAKTEPAKQVQQPADDSIVTPGTVEPSGEVAKTTAPSKSEEKASATEVAPALTKPDGPVETTPAPKTTMVPTGNTDTEIIVSNKAAEVKAFDDVSAKKDVAKEDDRKADNADAYERDLAGKKAKQAAAAGREIMANRTETRPQRNQVMHTFRGRVTDTANIGVPFANVTNIQDNAGTYTDANGFFNFRSPDTILDVQVRSIGFENTVTQLRNAAPTNRVVLEEDRSLNEMVISNQRPNAEARSRNVVNTLEEPEPADGWTNYDAYLANNLNVPEDYQNKPTSNPAVEVSFEVDNKGEPINIRVERSLCAKCDKEAVRLIKEGPKFKQNAARRGRTRVMINF